MTPTHPSALRSALDLYAQHARNPSNLIALNDRTRLYTAPGGGVPYLAAGPVWLAGEPLAATRDLPAVLAGFLGAARTARRVPVLVPVGPDTRQAAADLGLCAVHLGRTPYLDPRGWAPRGNRFASLRGDLNRARRCGVQVSEVTAMDAATQAELTRLGDAWLGTRRAGTPLNWIFRLAPLHHQGLKRTFTARDGHGTLLAFVSAAPLPGRAGWCLEDIVRDARSPRGTAAAVVADPLPPLGGGGGRRVTLGGAPLAGPGGGLHLRFLRPLLSRWYHFDGLLHFKSQFGADHWDDEWLIAPSLAALPLAAGAIVHQTFPGGLGPALRSWPAWSGPGPRGRHPAPDTLQAT